MKSFLSFSILLAVMLAAFSCATIPQVTQNEIKSINDLASEIKSEIKADEKAGRPIDYRKRAIVEKLENYSVTLSDKSKQEKVLAEEKSLADRYRLLRNIAIISCFIGLGVLAFKYKDVILELLRKLPGFPL